MSHILAIFIGGGLGSVARFAISKFSASFISESFPWGTLIANALSCLVLSASIGFFSDKIFSNAALRFFILTGFCGGFSTFSTFSNETIELMRSGNFMFAVLNIVLNVVICFGIILFFTKYN
jgi:fluoride exporter